MEVARDDGIRLRHVDAAMRALDHAFVGEGWLGSACSAATLARAAEAAHEEDHREDDDDDQDDSAHGALLRPPEKPLGSTRGAGTSVRGRATA